MIRRGEIWWTEVGDPHGSEPGYRHPALVLQRDDVNVSRIETVVVCVLTSNTALGQAPGNTLLPKRSTGLQRDSVVNASQIGTVDKTDLDSRVGKLSAQMMARVDEGLRWLLDLEP